MKATLIVFVQSQKVPKIPRLGRDLQWLIYFGYSAIASIDLSIAAMMCFILYKNRLEIGINHISQHGNRLLLNLITYALATGLITAWALGFYGPAKTRKAEFYIQVFRNPGPCVLYANSMLAMLNVRRRLKSGLVTDSLYLGNITNDIMFKGASLPLPGMSTQRRQDSISSGVAGPRQLPVIRTLQGASPIDPEKGVVEDEIEMRPSAKGSQWSAQSWYSLHYGGHTD
ncbi:hypothetical protein D9756_008718 [Leucocoprinus leucothites]|uniref:DUF6534 domain-containing protein n=1 Tax=Leucocoprinus leucothites TaxID=201217 RepID=A0A8H5CZA8_9AGAR|nr:hypothetical protein D9756_008718 [Leucoagaricus leucothites]